MWEYAKRLWYTRLVTMAAEWQQKSTGKLLCSVYLLYYDVITSMHTLHIIVYI